MRAPGYADFAESFAPGGLNGSVPCCGPGRERPDRGGRHDGGGPGEAQALRSRYRNMGTVPAANDAIGGWAMKQDRIDAVIPYDPVRNSKWYAYEKKGAPKYVYALLITEGVGDDAARRYGGPSTGTISQNNEISQSQDQLFGRLSDMTEWFAGQFTGSILRYDDQAPLVLYEHVQCGNDISEGKLLCPFLPVKRQETYDMAHPNTASPTSETGASSSPARIL